MGRAEAPKWFKRDRVPPVLPMGAGSALLVARVSGEFPMGADIETILSVFGMGFCRLDNGEPQKDQSTSE